MKQSIENKKQRKWATTQAVGATGVTTSTAFTVLTNISQGTTLATRVGSRIQIKRLRLHGQLVVGDATNIIRVGVFRWNVDNTSDSPGDDEIFDNTSDPLAHQVHYNPKRFKMLWEKVYSLDLYNPSKFFELDLKLDSLKTFNLGVNTGIGDLYITYTSDSSGVPNPSITYEAQIEWIDLE